MAKKFNVQIGYYGSATVTVEAETKEEALEKGESIIAFYTDQELCSACEFSQFGDTEVYEADEDEELSPQHFVKTCEDKFNEVVDKIPMQRLAADKSQTLYGNVIDWCRDYFGGPKDSMLTYMLIGHYQNQCECERREENELTSKFNDLIQKYGTDNRLDVRACCSEYGCRLGVNSVDYIYCDSGRLFAEFDSNTGDSEQLDVFNVAALRAYYNSLEQALKCVYNK